MKAMIEWEEQCTFSRLFLFIDELIFHRMFIPYFVPSPVDGHLEYFQDWALVTNAVMNVSMQDFVQIGVFISSERIAKTRISGSYDCLD